MILIGFLFIGLMMLVERPGYMIDSRSIKRGSRPSILIVSFVKSSNLCILGIIFIGSYLALIVVCSWCLSCLSWQGQVHRKRFSYASSLAFSVLEIFAGPSVRKVSLFHLLAKSPLPGFNISVLLSSSFQQNWIHLDWSFRAKVIQFQDLMFFTDR